MLGKIATGQQMAMLSEGRRRPGGESINNRTTGGLTNLDGGQCSRQGVIGNTTTNHQQERWRRSEAGGGCSDSDSGGKGEGVVAAASAAGAATAATTVESATMA